MSFVNSSYHGGGISTATLTCHSTSVNDVLVALIMTAAGYAGPHQAGWTTLVQEQAGIGGPYNWQIYVRQAGQIGGTFSWNTTPGATSAWMGTYRNVQVPTGAEVTGRVGAGSTFTVPVGANEMGIAYNVSGSGNVFYPGGVWTGRALSSQTGTEFGMAVVDTATAGAHSLSMGGGNGIAGGLQLKALALAGSLSRQAKDITYSGRTGRSILL